MTAGSRKADMIDAGIGSRVAARRAELGLSQGAFALVLGVSVQQVQKYESGANRISASRLHRMAQALGASPADFFPPQPPEPGTSSTSDAEAVNMAALIGTREGRVVAARFPLIADPFIRRAVARLIDALAGP